MKNIIIFATKYGCAEKTAKILAEKMNSDVSLVNVMKEKAPSLDEYDTVILGGSIYVGKVQKKLTEYISQNISELLKKKVGLFICAGQPEPVRTQELEGSFPKELFDHAVAKDVFGHAYNFEKLNFLDKLIVKKVVGITESQFNLSEEKIEEFARKILG